MTVNAEVPIVRLLGNGVNPIFPFEFSITATSNVLVYQNGQPMVENADYTVQYVPGARGGTVTFIKVPFPGSIIVLARSTPRSQTTDYTPYDAFPAETHEAALDKLTRIAQESYARAQFGLPLDVSSLFWDANGLRIQNGADPLQPNHYATKRYVDNVLSGGPGGGFDPADDFATYGNWVNVGDWQFIGSLTYRGSQVATVTQIPDVTLKADKSTQVLSGDTQVLTIVNPTLADDITIAPRVNVANGMLKLGADGLIPPSFLPGGGLEFLGGWEPSDGLPPNGTNPGQFYAFTSDGTITLKDANGVDTSYEVTAGEWAMWLDNPVQGWYYIERSGEIGIASNVLYDNTVIPAARRLDAVNVQAAIDEIAVKFANRSLNESISSTWDFTGARPRHQGVDLATVDDTPDLTDYAKRADNEQITGQWSFNVGVSLVGSRWPLGLGNDGQLLASNGAGQLEWINPPTSGMDPTQDYTIFGHWDFVDPTSWTGVRPTIDGARIATVAAETVTGQWTFTSGLTLNNGAAVSLNNSGGTPVSALVMSSGNVISAGSASGPFNLRSGSPLRYNDQPLNTAGGLVQVQANGKIPFDLIALSALSFIGTWDASGGNNPPNGTDGGQFYVIIKGGTLLVFVDDSGTPVLTPVDPGDYLLWLGAGSGYAAGWYHIVTEAPTLVDARNVFYDPSTAPWTATIVQDVLDEIGTRAAIKDQQSIFSAQLGVIGGNYLSLVDATNSAQMNLSANAGQGVVSGNINAFTVQLAGTNYATLTTTSFDLLFGNALTLFAPDNSTRVFHRVENAGSAYWNSVGVTQYQWYMAGALALTVDPTSIALPIGNAITFGPDAGFARNTQGPISGPIVRDSSGWRGPAIYHEAGGYESGQLYVVGLGAAPPTGTPGSIYFEIE